MATLIRLKRKLTSNNNGITLKKGEPYYNIADKHLYIGNEDGEIPEVHLTAITGVESTLSPESQGEEPWGGKDTVEFFIGADSQNRYKRRIEYVEKSYTAESAKVAEVAKALDGGKCVERITFDSEDNNLLVEYVGNPEIEVINLSNNNSTGTALKWKTF